jgi:hypothetical protein
MTNLNMLFAKSCPRHVVAIHILAHAVPSTRQGNIHGKIGKTATLINPQCAIETMQFANQRLATLQVATSD